jgi:hypothetical protein
MAQDQTPATTTKAIEDGGPAFPLSYLAAMNGAVVDFGATGGMALRDYFAAQVMTGLLANPDEVSADSPGGVAAYLARWSYTLADAMLLARKGGVA